MNQQDAAVCIRNREPFKASALSAANSIGRVGYLPSPWRDEYLVKHEANRLIYVVYSYATPIAWLDVDGVWTLPSLRYSTTTSKHQGITRRAIQEG